MTETASSPASEIDAQDVNDAIARIEGPNGLLAHIDDMSSAMFRPNLFLRDAADLRTVLAEVYSLRAALQQSRADSEQAQRDFKTLKLAVCMETAPVNDRIRDRYDELRADPARVDGEYGRYEVLRDMGFLSPQEAE